MGQRILEANGNYEVLDSWFSENHVTSAMLVCGESIKRQSINEYLGSVSSRLGIEVVRFMGFQPNPLYENVVNGVKLFQERSCDAIVAVGGGSAIDVAKCIKLYSGLPGDGAGGEWLKAEHIPNSIPFLAIPTTAGTGSEATRFAVIYFEGAKQSVSDYCCIPGTVLLDASMLRSLPDYQKKATMMDALCHAIESFWSVNSTDESKEYSKEAIQGVIKHMDAYFANTDEGNAGMLLAANAAGKAINMTQTTAGHAMCYKITSLFGFAHGHAAALCDRVLYPWMIDNIDKCCDPRGAEYLARTLYEIAVAMGCKNAKEGAKKLNEIFDSLELEVPKATAEQFELLKSSVNPVRLKNHPITLVVNTIDELYHMILNREEV